VGAILGAITSFQLYELDSVMERMFSTTFENGMPDTAPGHGNRRGDILNHPIIGHGPITRRRRVTIVWWPHNVSYHASSSGSSGLCFSGSVGIVESPARAPSLAAGSYIDGLTIVTGHAVTFMVDQTRSDLRNARFRFHLALPGLIWRFGRVAR
jgi:hypothetical protein